METTATARRPDATATLIRLPFGERATALRPCKKQMT